nr:hypothetical protein [uncultured Thiodictyon sp.]
MVGRNVHQAAQQRGTLLQVTRLALQAAQQPEYIGVARLRLQELAIERGCLPELSRLMKGQRLIQQGLRCGR